ncbi:hypothetical protein [Thioalkalivibrio sp. HK1]|uniref:hypothetical protein n=1 Tax=Thioalkalivibrio sp. HK1 TaxID=1469245 RepID=UPI0012DFB834|nr:hypothetical protein [Thioalkalivibrio sp. HK1]
MAISIGRHPSPRLANIRCGKKHPASPAVKGQDQSPGCRALAQDSAADRKRVEANASAALAAAPTTRL